MKKKNEYVIPLLKCGVKIDINLRYKRYFEKKYTNILIDKSVFVNRL